MYFVSMTKKLSRKPDHGTEPYGWSYEETSKIEEKYSEFGGNGHIHKVNTIPDGL